MQVIVSSYLLVLEAAAIYCRYKPQHNGVLHSGDVSSHMSCGAQAGQRRVGAAAAAEAAVHCGEGVNILQFQNIKICNSCGSMVGPYKYFSLHNE